MQLKRQGVSTEYDLCLLQCFDLILYKHGLFSEIDFVGKSEIGLLWNMNNGKPDMNDKLWLKGG